jgi:hypothetical protein
MLAGAYPGAIRQKTCRIVENTYVGNRYSGAYCDPLRCNRMRPLRSQDNVHDTIQLEIPKSIGICVRLLTDNVAKALTDNSVHEMTRPVPSIATPCSPSVMLHTLK